MEPNVLQFRRPKLRPLLDKQGRRIPHFFESTLSGEIFIRREFRKLRIPALFQTTGEKTIGRARSRAEVLVQRHKNLHLGISDDHVFGARVERTMSSLIDEVLREHTITCRPTTREKHLHHLELIRKEFGSREVKTISVRDFSEWVARLRLEPALPNRPKRTTYGDHAKHMNLVMRFAYERKYTTHLLKFRTKDAPAAEGRWYTDEELLRLWSVMNEDLRDQFVLAAECFMRLREILHLTWERVDLSTGKVTLRAEDVKTGSKTGRGREFFLTDNALRRMRARRERMSKMHWVFPSKGAWHRPTEDNKTAWGIAKKKAGLSGRARFHDLRHTAISKALLERNMSPLLVSQYAGVSLQVIERTYLHGRAKHSAPVAGAMNSVFAAEGNAEQRGHSVE